MRDPAWHQERARVKLLVSLPFLMVVSVCGLERERENSGGTGGSACPTRYDAYRSRRQ